MRKTAFVVVSALMAFAACRRDQLSKAPKTVPPALAGRLSPGIVEDMRRIQREHAAEIFASPAVQAFCIGSGESGGIFRVYVSRGVRPEFLPASLGPYPVRAVETGPIRPLSNPALMGTSTSNNAGRFSGTLGMAAIDNKKNKFGYITNNHVAAATATVCPNGNLKDNLVATQLAPGKSATYCGSPEVIGELLKAPQIVLSPTYPNIVDAAFVKSKNVGVSAVNACGICPTIHGPLHAVAPIDALQTTVRKCSAFVTDRVCTSKMACGTVTDIDCMVHVGYPGCGLPALFVGQVEVDGSYFSGPGDSGSILFDQGSGVVGLLFAGDGSYHTFVNPMAVVLKELDVRMAPIQCERDVVCDR